MADQTESFSLDAIFPDADAVFSARYKSLEGIKSTALVAIDTNVLLAPYSIGSSSFEELIKIFKDLALHKRLMIPGHVAREYARRRVAQLADFVKNLKDHSSKASVPLHAAECFLDSDAEYQRARKKAEEIEKNLKEVRRGIVALADKLADPSSDPVLNAYADIFAGCVVDHGLDDAGKAAFTADMEARYRNRVPPGYKDAGKDDNKEGDLVIWKTLLKVGAERSCDMIFVTSEEKGDWWVNVAGVPFQPRHELIEEYRRASRGASIHIVPLHRLLTIFGANKKSVSAVVEAERETSTKRFMNSDREHRERRLHYDVARLNYLLRKKRRELESVPEISEDRELIPPWMSTRSAVERELIDLQFQRARALRALRGLETEEYEEEPPISDEAP